MAAHPLPEEPSARRDAEAQGSGEPDGDRTEDTVSGPATSPPTRLPVRLSRRVSARLFARRRRWWVEIVVVLIGYQVYQWTRGAAPAHQGEARHNGLAIWHAEQWMHLDPEPWLNNALESVHPFAVMAGYYYLSLNFFVPIGMLVWLYRRRPLYYGPLRWVLGVLTMISLVCFWLLPVAPPRFVVPGLVDTVATSHLIGAAYSDHVAPHANLYAAMPSLHVAWAGWCTIAALWACRRVWVRAVFSIYPAVTTVDILATANHYLLDAVGGAVLLGLAYGIVALVGLTRPLRHAPRPTDPVSIRKQ